MKKPSSPLVVILFALSGICGLIYEVAWSKYLSLFIGSTAYAHMLVLATFMGGLAYGAFVLGKLVDGARNPLLFYGLVEIAIGLYCLAYPPLLSFLENVFVSTAIALDASSRPTLFLFLKFLLSFSTIIIPTFLMGGTLPILTKFFTKNINDTGNRVAILYFVNSMGAVIGAALAGFFLIRYLGLDSTVWFTAGVNVLIGFAAVSFSRSVVESSTQLSPVLSQPLPARQVFSKLTTDIAIVTAGASGFIVMLYEITWIRLLANILGSSTYSFSLMLVAFISGIALGSLLVSALISKIKNLYLFLGVCQLGTAVSMILTLPLYERLPYYLWKIAAIFSSTPESFPVFLSVEFLFCFLIMIVPTTFSGMSLPVVAHIASNDITILGKSIGGIFSVNTAGTVLGALTTGLVLIPAFGVKQSLEIGVALNAALGILIVSHDGAVALRWKVGLALVILLIGSGYRFQYPEWNQQVAASGVFRSLSEPPPPSYAAFVEGRQNGKMLYFNEGVNANVAVIETQKEGGRLDKALIINGKTDGSSFNDLTTQILLAHIPLMLLPDSAKALVIGFGTGITVGSALKHPLSSLDCVEISPEVIEASVHFASENGFALLDRRVRISLEDAVTYLKVTEKKYDYIMSEPSNPWIAGVGNLFSADFFALCKRRIEPNGVMVQWFHLYEMNDQVFEIVLRTFTQAFPYVTIWVPLNFDVILLGSMQPIIPDFDTMERKMTDESIRQDLARIAVRDIPTLLSLQAISESNTALIAGEGEVNTDRKPLLEFLAPVYLFTGESSVYLATVDERFTTRGENLLLTTYAQRRTLTFENYLNIARYQTEAPSGNLRFAYTALAKTLEMQPRNREALVGLAGVSQSLGLKEEHRLTLQKLAEQYPNDPQILYEYAVAKYQLLRESMSAIHPKDMGDVVKLLQLCITLTQGSDERYFALLANAFLLTGRYAEAAENYKKILDVRKRVGVPQNALPNDQLYVLITNSYISAQQPDMAGDFLQQLIAHDPQNAQIPILELKIHQIGQTSSGSVGTHNQSGNLQ
jgi:spermidine synthase